MRDNFPLFSRYDSLGFNTPYYTVFDKQIIVEEHFANAINHLPKAPKLDIAAVIEVLSRYHCFANRTLVQGVYRSPWMATVERNEWVYADLPSYGSKKLSSSEVAKILFTKLQEEILAYCNRRQTIGILLSGGMDSRMVAGVLDYLLKTKQISANVVAITWGGKETRDVVYAQQIAQRLGWEWIHYPISAKILRNNITEAAKHGCEYSPVHLHAMPNVREIIGVDCILGASYGDSIGRGEYSGKHITQLPPFEKYTQNWFNFVHEEAYQEALLDIEEDVKIYRTRYPKELLMQQHEIDWQAHYMRRKLNHCMGVISEKIPLLQVFTSQNVFSFMWSLSPSVRNDFVYQELLTLFYTKLADIPWARTGRPFLSVGRPVDGLSSRHHEYGTWIRGELHETIKEKVLSTALQSLGIFNMQALESALVLNQKLTHQVHTSKIDEIAIWLTSLAEFIELYDIKGVQSTPTIRDTLSSLFVTPLQVVGLAAAKFIMRRK